MVFSDGMNGFDEQKKKSSERTFLSSADGANLIHRCQLHVQVRLEVVSGSMGARVPCNDLFQAALHTDTLEGRPLSNLHLQRPAL